ncbi:MAG: WecB/TagA/CpsF family glycosyltransferase [Candidatus Saccharibacteria bacterium]
MKIDIAGIGIDNVTKAEVLDKLSGFAESGEPHLVATAYSEFVVFAQKDPRYRDVLNSAALVLPDGIGMLWAAKFLSLPMRWPGPLKFLQALIQVVYTGASLIFYPRYCRTVIKEQVTGSLLVWDIAELCAKQGLRLALAGGFEGTADIAARRLKEKFPDLAVSFVASDCRFDDVLVSRIKASNSDILLIAYQPPRQEIWLAENLQNLNIKACLGLGGTFDYLAGKRPLAPRFLHYMGLEWFWRLLTQPWRLKRMWNAIPVFISAVLRHKMR